MLVRLTLVLIALSAAAAQPAVLASNETEGDCDNFTAEAWMESLPAPLLIDEHQYELVLEAEEVPDYEEASVADDPDHEPNDSESTDDSATEHLGELNRRRRDAEDNEYLTTSEAPVTDDTEGLAPNNRVEEAVEEAPLAMLRLKKCHKNSGLALPNKANKVMLKNFQKSKMSFFLSIEPQDSEACGSGSILKYHFYKLQGCWLEHKHKAHEICRHQLVKEFHKHRHHRETPLDGYDNKEEELSGGEFRLEESYSAAPPVDEPVDGHAVDEPVDGHDETSYSGHDENMNEVDRGHSGRDLHGERHDHGGRGHHGGRDHHDGHHGGRDHHDGHHGGRDHHDGHHGGRDHHGGHHGGSGHHHHHHHDNDDHVHDHHDDGNFTHKEPRRNHHHVPAEGEVRVCDTNLEGWLEPESKLVLEYVTPACGCFVINAHVSYEVDNGSSLVLTPDANAEYLQVFECVESYSSEEEHGDDYGPHNVNLDGIDPNNIIRDDHHDDADSNDSNSSDSKSNEDDSNSSDSKSNEDDSNSSGSKSDEDDSNSNDSNDEDDSNSNDSNDEDDSNSNDSNDEDDSNSSDSKSDEDGIDSDEDTNDRRRVSARRRSGYSLRSRVPRPRIHSDEDDDDEDDDDDDDDDFHHNDIGRHSRRERRSPQGDDAEQQAADANARREERRRRRQEKRRRTAERRRNRGHTGAGDAETAEVDPAANIVDPDEDAARQERRRQRQLRRQQRRQREQGGEGGNGRGGRGRGNRRRGNTEEPEASGDVGPLQVTGTSTDAAAVHRSDGETRAQRRVRNSARRSNRMILRNTNGLGQRFCCKEGLQHKKASFFPDTAGARSTLECELVPDEVEMWASHKYDLAADECRQLYTSCCQRLNLNQWNDWFASSVPRETENEVDIQGKA